MSRALVVLSFVTALGGYTLWWMARRPAAPQSKRELVLLVTIDSLRASYLGAYGATFGASPHIDELAASSHVFTRAYSTCSWTRPSMVSLFTSLPLSDHLVVTSPVLTKRESRKVDPVFLRITRLPETFPLFHEGMKGFRKAAFVTNPMISPSAGLKRGWDVYEDLPERVRDEQVLSVTPAANRRILDFIDGSKSDRLFVWVHYNDVHAPYGPASKYIREFQPELSAADVAESDTSRKFSRAMRNATVPETFTYVTALYKAGIKQFDEHFGSLIAELKQRGLYDSAHIVLVADHGEEFLEHKQYGHGKNLYDTTLSIPLLVKLPGQTSSKRHNAEVSLLDLGPTILDAVGAPNSSSFAGASLMPLMRGGKLEDRPLYGLLYDKQERLLHSIVYRGLKLIVNHRTSGGWRILPATRRLELFDLNADPGEQKRLSLGGVNTDKVKDLEARLLQRIRTYDVFEELPLLIKRHPAAAPLDEDSKALFEQLKALGYAE